MSTETTDEYNDAQKAVAVLLNLVREVYDVGTYKHKEDGHWIISTSFKKNNEWFTIAVKGKEYQPAFIDLLLKVRDFKKSDGVPDGIKMSDGGHPVEIIQDMEI